MPTLFTEKGKTGLGHLLYIFHILSRVLWALIVKKNCIILMQIISYKMLKVKLIRESPVIACIMGRDVGPTGAYTQEKPGSNEE